MQTVLGANGQIGTELARELYRNHTRDLRLVSRNPRRLHESDELVAADLLDPEQADRAVAGSEIAYLTVGLPPDSKLWAQQLPVMMRNVIDACETHGAKLVFFDNTYMYSPTASPQTEQTPFRPVGSKAQTRANIAAMLLDAMEQGRVEGVICRAPEFYGPGATQSLSNSMVFSRIGRGEKALIPLSDSTRRTLIWTPDASRATALIGNTPSAYGQTWHLPCADDHPDYAQLVTWAGQAWGKAAKSSVLSRPMLAMARLFNKELREFWPLMPRYGVDLDFDSSKFKRAFPDFEVTGYAEGLRAIAAEGSPAAGSQGRVG